MRRTCEISSMHDDPLWGHDKVLLEDVIGSWQNLRAKYSLELAMRRLPIIATLLMMIAGPAAAVDRTFEIEVENSLKSSVPKDWFLRASWRDETLVIFVSPPVPQSFEIWYDSDRQKTILEDVCKVVPQTIWGKVG